ncbi:MAG: ABC transporter permease, partial [Acidobacteria bacterium]|nr:ABC transporter permease [Acidobacteriota bacterium]
MRFAVRMALRELRSSARRLALFFIAVGIGVAAIVVLRSAADSLQAALTSESRFLMAADVTVSTGEGFTDETEAIFDDVASGHPLTGVSRSAQIATLARSADDPLRGAMVELKGVDGAFPLYGEMETDGVRFGPELLAGRGALVRPEVRVRLGLEVGDPIVLGGEPFEVRGELLAEPGAGIDFFRRGPRVLVALSDLEGTGLLDIPERARWEVLFAVDSEEAVGGLSAGLRAALEDHPVRVRTFRQTGDRLARRIRRGEDYLSLAGFVILLLGGIGVFSVARAFTRQSLPSAAIERCLGVPSRTILLIALLQMAVLAGLASAFGIAAGAVALQLFIPEVEVGGLQVAARLTPAAALQGALTG